jgi:hypothetical protein
MFPRFLIDFMDRCPSVASGFLTGEYSRSHHQNIAISLTFCRYENCAWAPLLLVFVVVTGVSAKHFVDTPTAPATVKQIFSFAATIAGNMIPYSILSSDYTAYFHPRVSRFEEFCGVSHENLISKELVGEFLHTHISASLFLL